MVEKALIILNYNIKLGIKSSVKIKKMGAKSYQIQVPKYEVLGIDFDSETPYELYDESGELFSAFAKKIDTGKVATDALKNKKKQKKFIKQYRSSINESVENYYKTFFTSIDDEIEIDFVFSN